MSIDITNYYGGELSIFQKMIRRKPLTSSEILNIDCIEQRDNNNDNNNNQDKLKRVLSVFDIISFGIAGAVGSGVFVIAGEAGQYSGAGLFLSFIIGGISCLFCGLCYAEFSTRVPVSGSAYTYAYCSLGEIIGFIIGWDLTLEYGISAATIAQGWSFYLQSLLQSFGINQKHLPSILFGHNIDQIFTINITAGLLIISMTILLLKGIRESAWFTNMITIWNILLIIGFTVAGCFFIDSNNWFNPCDNHKYNTSCDSNDKNGMFPLGISGIFRASGIVFFSFVGFDSVSTLAEETKNPKRDMVIGILGTLTIATILYIGVSLVLTGMIPFTALDQNAPLSQAFKDHDQTLLSIIVSIGALTTTTATTLACLIGQPRIFYRMAHDGLFFNIFKNISYGTFISGVIACLIGTFINFNLLAEMISVGTLMAYILVCGGVVILRYEDIINNYKTYISKKQYDKLDDDDEKSIDNLDSTKYDNKLTNNLPILISIFAILCICFGFIVDETQFEYPPVLILIGSLILILFGCIVYIDQSLKNVNSEIEIKKNDKLFLCPLCPYFPCLGIFVNSYMIASLKWESFARVIIWFIFGFTLYLFYGSKNSNLNYLKDVLSGKHKKLLDHDQNKSIQNIEEQQIQIEQE